MRKFVFVMTALTGLLIAQVIYERLYAVKSFGPSAMLVTGLLILTFLFLAVTWFLYPTRHRQTVAGLWLACLSLGVTYFALDLAIGYFLIRPLSPPLVPDDYRHHKLVANSQALLEQRDFRYLQRINNFGVRGRDVTADKPANVYRILMLGDSFTMGKGVEDDQTFAVVLERSLNEAPACREGRSIEIINGGIDSYSPILSYIELTRELHPLSPDMVILNFDASDLLQDLAYRQTATFGEGGEIVAVPQRRARVTLNERVRMWAERHLFFTRALMYYVNQAMGYRSLTVQEVVAQANYDTIAHTLAEDTVARDSQWASVFDSIRRIKEYCDEHGITFLLSIYPWGHQVSPTEWIPGRYSFMARDATASDRSVEILGTFAAEQGIDFINVFPTFRARRHEAPLYFEHDMHWTPAGHVVMAAGLQQHLTERYPAASCR